MEGAFFMFDRIIYISDHSANVKLVEGTNVTINLMNLHVIFEDNLKKILGEVDDLDGDIVKIRFLGEIVNGKLMGGVIRKPSLDAKVRVIDQSEVPLITGQDAQGYMKLGVSPFYNDYPVFLDVNNFFSNHFAIFGNSGSGKSCGISRLFQNMFHDQRLFPYKANIIMFDSSGEYYNAFSNLNSINSNYHYRFYSTNEVGTNAEKLRLPIFLLNVDDLALLLQVTNHSQLPIIERMLKLALIFSQKDMDAENYKNHLIAKAIMTILYTNETSPNKRNEIFSILASCSTQQFNLEAPVQGIGYTRKFRECFLIDNQGQFSESVLLTEYVSSFIKAEYDNYEPKGGVYFDLDTLEKALNFTLISEGWLRNENTYGDAVTIKVRLHSLIVGENAKFFDYPEYITLESYLSSMLISNNNKYQIININLDDVDDDFAKVITKIYSRLIFEFSKALPNRASIPFHIIVEEAHRYIQNDTDRFLIGYNVFERIAKEGRKYGVILGLISQRPVELSDTVISQCSNFLIFKMNHPVDVDYIRKMVPNISDEIVEKQKTLQAGTCLGFGMAFRIPLIVKMEMPDPAPWSGNCDVVSIWNGNGSVNTSGGNTNSVNSNSMPQSSIPSTMPVQQSAPISMPTQQPAFIQQTNTSSVPTVNSMNNIPKNPFLENSNDAILSIPQPPSEMNNSSNIQNNNIPVNNNLNNSNVTTGLGVADLNKINMMSNTNSFTDDILNGINNNFSLPVGGFPMDNVNLQSAIPDFTTTSEDERAGIVPQNSFTIPSSLDIAANQTAVVPTVDVNKKDDDYGTVRIVPPNLNESNSDGDNSGNSFFGGSGGSNSTIPRTDSGTPLVTIVN